ncbi:MAG: alpha/beta fold hydrolase [Verrucomicrobiota bacterium]
MIEAVNLCPIGSPAFSKVNEYPALGGYFILLHGMLGHDRSMAPAAEYFQKRKFHAIVISYPSTRLSIKNTSKQVLQPAIRKHCLNLTKKIHFVGHSMGGLVIRYYLSKNPPTNLGRVVMIATPNQGNKFADTFADCFPVDNILGPALRELKTTARSLPNALGPVDYKLGAIMGRGSLIPKLSVILPFENGGIVRIDSGRVAGMTDFVIIRGRHAALKRSKEVIYQAYFFLKQEKFDNHPPKEEIRKGMFFLNLLSPIGNAPSSDKIKSLHTRH